MPGLAELKLARQRQMGIAYQEVKGSASSTYSTAAASLVAALHQWFDAQLSDHGKDAMKGHHHHQRPPKL